MRSWYRWIILLYRVWQRCCMAIQIRWNEGPAAFHLDYVVGPTRFILDTGIVQKIGGHYWQVLKSYSKMRPKFHLRPTYFYNLIWYFQNMILFCRLDKYSQNWLLSTRVATIIIPSYTYLYTTFIPVLQSFGFLLSCVQEKQLHRVPDLSGFDSKP